MNRALTIGTAVALGPITGPLFVGFIRCAERRRYAMAAWYAVGIIETPVVLSVVLAQLARHLGVAA